MATWAVLAALAGINRDVARADLSTRPGRRTGRSPGVPHTLDVASPRVRFRNIFMCLPLVPLIAWCHLKVASCDPQVRGDTRANDAEWCSWHGGGPWCVILLHIALCLDANLVAQGRF